MNNNELNNNSLAIILLCSNLAINYRVDSIKPFTIVEWSKLAKIIWGSSIKEPANLFNMSKEQIKDELLIGEKESDRIVKLLSKAGQLTFELNELKKLGINITTRADKTYPKILRERLKDKCPPMIYYCGNIEILHNNLIGVVGSRAIDEDGLNFTKKLAKKIVDDKYSLVSGGAKGVDSISQEEVLKNNGKVVSFIADSMINKIKKKEIREAIIKGNLLLMGAVNPRSGFTVYSAMDRNKYIYGLSKFTVVVSSDYNKGGTWAGATENLKNEWVPMLVRYEENIPKGNLELIRLGGNKFGNESFNNDFMNSILNRKHENEKYEEINLFSLANNNIVNLESIIKEQKNIESSINENVEKYGEEEVKKKKEYDVYSLIINNIIEALNEELSVEEFCNKFNINKTQGQIWLKRASEEGKIKKLSKPVRYKSI